MEHIIDKWPIILDRLTTITIIGWIALTVHQMSIQQSIQIEQQKQAVTWRQGIEARMYSLENYHKQPSPTPQKLDYRPKHIMKPDQRLDPKRAISAKLLN